MYRLLPRVVYAWLWLACRWYRSQINKSGLVCCVHQDREATLQCTICARHAQNPAEKRQSYHCSPDCLKQHWATHRKLHIKQQKRAQGAQPSEHLARLRALIISMVFVSYLLRLQQPMPPTTGHVTENGYSSFPEHNIRGSQTNSNNETWVEVSKPF